MAVPNSHKVSRPGQRRQRSTNRSAVLVQLPLTDVLGVVQPGISAFLIRQAGFTVASGAKTGAVSLIQRFGSALNSRG